MNPYVRWGTEHCTSLYEERYIRPEFVVSVDTSNREIRKILEDGLNKTEGKKMQILHISYENQSNSCSRIETIKKGY